MNEKPQEVSERAFEFAVRVVRLCQILDLKPGVSRTLANQLLKSGTSIGANLEESKGGQSRADYLSKVSIALKEARETNYWLRLLIAADVISEMQLSSLLGEFDQPIAILTTIVKKLNSHLLLHMETHRIETKRELTPDLDLEKEVIAFLNTPDGGLIFIGIDKTGTRVGVADVDGDMLKIKDRIKNNITPSAMGLFDVLAEESGGVTCIKIIVAGGSEKPYFKKKYGMTEKGCFLRVGTAAEPMPTSMIERLFASRTRNSIGKIKAHRQSLSFEQLRIYCEEKGKRLNQQFKRNLFKDLELVEHLGSGIPRITQFYPESAFHFTENFLRMTFPAIEPVYANEEGDSQVTGQATPQVTPKSRLCSKK